MALATQCPHCGTMFRVASDQLKLRGGIVRCGACQEIFDGSATLVDLDKLPLNAPVETPPDSTVDAAAAPAPAVTDDTPFAIVDADDDKTDTPALEASLGKPGGEEMPVYTLDFDHTFDPLGILPKVEASDAAVAPPVDAAPPAPPEAGPDTAHDEELREAVEATDVPSTQPVASVDSEVDALSLVQPWSRAAQDAEQDAAPASDAPAAAHEELADAALAAPAEEPAAAVPPEHSAPSAPPAAPDSSGRYEPAFGLPVDEELVAAPLPDHEPEPVAGAARRTRPRADDLAPLLARESAPSIITPAAPSLPPVSRTPAAKRAEKAAARRSKLVPTKIEAQPKLRAAEIDEPEFVKRSRHQEQSGRTRKIAMLAGSVLLLMALLTQGALTFRNDLAARFPGAKPVLVAGCAVFGCRVELPAQVDKLAIETGELTTLGGGVYSFATELRNEAGTAQAWPSLELALTDANDKPLVRRVIAPGEYLAAGTPLADGIAAGAEQAIKLHFRVDNLKPSGYHIAVFYP